MSDVQGLVDALALELDRPVGVEDRRFRMIAYSSHDEHVDQVRLASILRREAPLGVADWLDSLGVGNAERFVRVPANERFGMAARVCVPIHFDDTLLGYLWLLDEPAATTDAQLEKSLDYAAELAVAMYRTRLLERESRERERELAAQALGLGAEENRAAAAELISAGHLAGAATYVALVLRASHPGRAQPPPTVRVHLVDSAEHLRRSLAPHHTLVVDAAEEVVVVLASGSAEETGRRAETLLAAAREGLRDASGWSVLVGVGEGTETPEGLPGSYRQARQAAWVGAALANDAGVVAWSDLGAYRTIASLLGEDEQAVTLPAPLRRLLACEEAETLTRTLECYLDLGGDARAAAAALYVHRSSLYGRLHRIEEIAGVDLRSGEDRLDLHLGIRLWRLLGGGFEAD